MHALVIDDSRAMRMIVRRSMTRLGFTVAEAEDGQQALDVLADSDVVPDIALVDWNMPVMNGLEFIKAVRREPAYRQMSLMMVTTESEHSQIVRALAAGAHEYLLKPFGEDALQDKLSMLGLVAA